MWKLVNTLEEVESPYNGNIKVIKTIEGTRIVVGGLSQSGWLVKKVWKAALAKIKKIKPNVDSILILGLGGGSAAELVNEYWLDSKKVGVDIDEKIVALGAKYLNLDKIKNLEVVIGDATTYVAEKENFGKFDLVLVDLYKGAEIPKDFRSRGFAESVKQLLKKDGIAAFNHLYSWVEKKDAGEFGENLRAAFSSRTIVKPEANIIFICWG